MKSSGKVVHFSFHMLHTHTCAAIFHNFFSTAPNFSSPFSPPFHKTLLFYYPSYSSCQNTQSHTCLRQCPGVSLQLFSCGINIFSCGFFSMHAASSSNLQTCCPVGMWGGLVETELKYNVCILLKYSIHTFSLKMPKEF